MNENLELKIEKLEHCIALPTYATEGSAGMDLVAANKEPITLGSLERTLIPTGIKIQLPKGYEAQVRARSGMAIKHGITLSNCVGTIDEDYRGEVCVGIINLSKESYTINPGDRIAQMIIAKVEHVKISTVNSLDETQRATGGFGSTGYRG
ncbi:MAG: dUTP diphosphatase [bacterium]